MSVGQVVGGVVGAVAGFMLPGVGFAIGAQLGIMVGGYIDPPKGPNIEGPRLTDLTVQTSTYGAPKTRAYGTIAVTGNVFWLEGDKYVEHAHEQESGGKGGGGGATQTSYTYSATFAVALTEGQEITGIRRLWLGDNLIYDAGSDDLDSIIASNIGGGSIGGSAFNDVASWLINALTSGHNWKLYTGADDQEPDPRMQADKGAANVSAYPGRCYIVFYDQDLTEKYSNTLLRAQVKAELVCAGPVDSQNETLGSLFIGESAGVDHDFHGAMIGSSGSGYVMLRTVAIGSAPIAIRWGAIEYPFYESYTETDISAPAGGWGYTYRLYDIAQTDTAAVLTAQTQYSGYYEPWYRLITPGGVQFSSGQHISQAGLKWSGGGQVIFDRGDIFLSTPDYSGTDGKLQKINIYTGWEADTGLYPSIGWIGASENYLFMATHMGTTPTVRRFSRTTFTEVDAWSIPSLSSFYVGDDDTIYTSHPIGGGGVTIRKWENGVQVLEQVAAFPLTAGLGWFRVFSDEPFYAVAYRDNYAGDSRGYFHIAHQVIAQSSAKLRDIVTAECALAGVDSSDLDLLGLTNSDVRGYRVAGVGSPRAALEPLQAAFPFDVYQKGYKVGFKSRGSASVVTVPEIDLGASDGSPGILLPVAREMETQIARMVTVKHLDADRDYEIGEQTSPERPGVSSVAPRTVDLALVLTADEATQIADVLNSKDWTERVSFGPFSLPPTYANLEPSDIITVQHRSRDWEMRLTRVEYMPDGRITCQGVLTASAAYSSTAQGSDPLTLGKSLVPLYGSSRVVLLDIPRIDSAQDNPGISAVMYGFSSGWPGGVLVRSDDSGTTWNSVAGFSAKARVFTVTESMPSASPYAIDNATVLTLTPLHSTATLYGITEDQLYSYQNLAAIGADGRWEIVAFKTVTDNTGTYTVKDFLRGLYGSEWASGLHAAGDTIVMLDSSTAGFVGLPTTAINSPRLWRAVTQGASVSSAPDIADTYEAHNLKPLAPVDVRGSINASTNDWTIAAARRTRWPVALFSGATVPLGETSESYQVDIYNNDFSAIKRTLTATTPSVTYTSAQQVADFGLNQASVYVDWAMVSSVVGAGYKQRATITAPALPDPYGGYVVLLMRNDDVALSDQMGNAVTQIGGVTRVSDVSAYNGYAASFNGTNAALAMADKGAWTISGDFLIEARVKISSLASESCLISHWYSGVAVNCAFAVRVTTGGRVRFTYGQGGTNADITGTTASVPTGSYVWVAVWRNGSTIRMAVDSTVDATTGTVSGALNDCPDRLGVGVMSVDRTQVLWANASIDELRFTNGSCRGLTTTYSPPTGTLPSP